MKKIILIIYLNIISLQVIADINDLTTATFSRSDSDTLADPAYVLGHKLDSIITSIKGRFISYMLLPDNESYYIFTSENYIHLVNNENKKYLDGWPLTPYTNHLYLAGEYIAAYKEDIAVHGKTADDVSDPGVIVNRGVLYDYNAYSGGTNKAGCLRDIPLRYGDINGDNINELALFLGTDIIVFSTTLNEVIFSAHYWLDDELSTKEVSQYFEGRVKNTDPEYIAFSGTDILINKIYPARRSLSKLYFGQFNTDQQHDIIVWRKLYQSRLRNNPAPGFDKVGERLVHYSLVEGRYQLEQTPDATIQTWLTDNNLTWSKGYPDFSECPGEEGKLIPEMHDPLLNDPDVLK